MDRKRRKVVCRRHKDKQ